MTIIVTFVNNKILFDVAGTTEDTKEENDSLEKLLKMKGIAYDRQENSNLFWVNPNSFKSFSELESLFNQFRQKWSSEPDFFESSLGTYKFNFIIPESKKNEEMELRLSLMKNKLTPDEYKSKLNALKVSSAEIIKEAIAKSISSAPSPQ